MEIPKTEKLGNAEFWRTIQVGRQHIWLQSITITHTTGHELRRKGWYSNGKNEVPETIDSSKTPFAPLILLVPPELLGTHEDVIGNPNDPQREPSGFVEINFSTGWNGSPLAASVYSRCQGNKLINCASYSGITERLTRNGGVGILEDFPYGELGILDGHHRRAMAELSSEQRLNLVPIQIIPYLFHESVLLDTWHDDRKVWSAEQVFSCFKTPNRFADAKRTKFGIMGKDCVPRRILDAQPNVNIPKRVLV